MAYESLKAALDAKIYPNGNEEVTASMINSVIADCISQLGNFECGGEITPTTLFDFNTELKWWFIAVESGTYANFDGIELDGETAVILYEDGVFTAIRISQTDPSYDSITINGDIVVSGKVDGRDVSADGEKLDGIEEGAQANVNADWNSTTGDSEILNKPTDVTDLSAHASSELSDGADLVKGSASSTDNAIARYNGTTGKVVQNSPATLDDDGNVSGLKDTSTETVTIDSAVQMSYDSVNEELKFTFI